MSDEDLGIESTALDAVISEVGGSADLERALAGEIDGTLDLSGAGGAISTEGGGEGVDALLDEVIRGLPILDESTGEVSLVAPEGDLRFSLAPVGVVATGSADGVVETTAAGGDFAAVSHVTEDLGGQIITAVDSDEATYVDFTVDAPEGFTLRPTADGGVDLVDDAGVAQGRIAAPWAFDQTGVKIAAAVSKVGGTGEAAKALVKKALFELRAKVPSGVCSTLPQVTLTAKDKAFVSVAWAFVMDNIWDLIGLGSCASLWKEARR